jgi:hypothetical protein
MKHSILAAIVTGQQFTISGQGTYRLTESDEGYTLVSVDPVVGAPKDLKTPGALSVTYNETKLDLADLMNAIEKGKVQIDFDPSGRWFPGTRPQMA